MARGNFNGKQLAVARDDARNDFQFFTRWMLLQGRGRRWITAPHHALICKALMDVFRLKTLRLIVNLPPRYSKTILAQNFVAWSLGHYPDSEFIYTSYAANLAELNSWETRDLVQSEEYQSIFPQVKIRPDAQRRDHWRTTAGGVVYAAGAKGTITGFGAGKMRPGFGGAIFIDDPHKPDEVLSDVEREKVLRWFSNTLVSRCNDAETPIVVIMQRLHELDLSGWLLNAGGWKHLCVPAIQEDGTALWPEKHSIEELRLMEAANPYDFYGQFMQRPTPPGGALFKPDQIKVLEAEPAGVRWVRGWDLAGTSGGGDYTAGVKMGMWDGKPVVADVVRIQGSPDRVERTLVATSSQDGQSCEINLPQDPGQAGKHQVQYFTSKLAGYRVKSSPETGDKVTRAGPLAAQVNVGNVYIVRGDWNRFFTEELRVFPNGANDDQVDAASRAFASLVTARRSFIDFV